MHLLLPGTAEHVVKHKVVRQACVDERHLGPVHLHDALFPGLRLAAGPQSTHPLSLCDPVYKLRGRCSGGGGLAWRSTKNRRPGRSGSSPPCPFNLRGDS